MKIRSLKGKRVILRVDFNVPYQGAVITDDFRISSALPTIKKIINAGAQVFLITHLEKNNQPPHLDVIARYLRRTFPNLRFLKGQIPQKPQRYSESVILFDNIRLNPGEKQNNQAFAKRIASWADYFINDAFSVSHRTHASVVGIPRFLPSELGPLAKVEIKEISRAFHAARPFLFILGGMKFSTKEPLLKKFLNVADIVVITGALANTFLAQRGFLVGASLVEQTAIPKKILRHKNILLPYDVVVLRNKKKMNVDRHHLLKEDFIYDAGAKTVREIAHMAQKAKFILWNGTLGFCEKGFCNGTESIARAIGKSKAYSMVGGGDTVAALRQRGLEKNFNFVSTGGGAMLEFLAKRTLPGIEAIRRSRK